MVGKNQNRNGVIDLLENSREMYYYDSEEVKDFTPEQKSAWNKMFECHEKISSILRGNIRIANKGSWGQSADAPVTAYLLSKAGAYNNPFEVSLKTLLSDEMDEIKFVSDNLNLGKVWKKLTELLKEYEPYVFRLVANLRDMSNPLSTPESIQQLANKILKIKKSDSFADICCGTGTVIEAIKQLNPGISATGFDNDKNAIAVAKLRNNLKDDKIEYICQDVFDLVGKEGSKRKFKKVFANYPFAMHLRELESGKKYLDWLEERIPSISKATSSDWLYNMLLVDILENGGKAVAIMTNGSTWNRIDAPIRKYFIENGLVECVIALPSKMFSQLAIQTSMIVFSHDNEGVRLVDATNLYTQGRRSNEMDDEQCKKVLTAMTKDSEISSFISKEKLRENDYVLNSSRYVTNHEEMEWGTKFEDVVRRITRGAPLNAKELDKISLQTPTDLRYLMLANVKDGMIDQELPYLSEIEKKLDKYCLKNHCLILSKNGYPYKIAVAEIKDGQRILANGNLYIVELDEEKVDPYYLAAFLGSEKGTALLKSITVGTTMPNIGVEALLSLTIPVPPIEKQRKIAERYKTVKDEIALLQYKMEKAKNRIAHILDEGGDE